MSRLLNALTVAAVVVVMLATFGMLWAALGR